MALPRANGSSYDVFLSFRGEDTRHSFTDHLYAALEHAGIKTFRDSNDAERGEELKQEIEGAIKASDGSIIVLSENYATSTWCLDELSLILDRRRDCHHSVLPVFYKVDPSDVRKQKGTFYIQADSSSRRWTDDNVNRWKAALTEVADLIGERVVGSEVDFLKKIVDAIYNRLYRKKIYIPPNLIGMDAREKEIKAWINQSESKFLVIYGMVGSGKSTLAQYIVYSNIQSFETVSIVQNIGQRCKEPHDMVKLQEQLCTDMLRGKDTRIPSVCQGTPKIEVLLERKKALIVLDDIVKESQLEDLLGSGNINKESKIIVTTDNDISNWLDLKSRRYEEYKMELLNDKESLELLSLHAFRSKTPMDGFKELAERVVDYCEGSPLALEVLASSLSKDNSIRSWKSALKLLGKDFHGDIYDVLKRSYDSLPYDSDKELFLHIACFFVGKDMDYIVKILEPKYSAESKIKTLIKRCFLYVTPNKQLMMHRLFQDMGRSLVDRESRRLAKRSRLWRNKDSYDMLRRGKSSDLLQGLTLDMRVLMKEDEFISQQLEESPLTTDSLRRMDQLKLLQLNYVKLTGSYKDSSHHLLWLCWFGYDKSIIGSDILMGNMVALDLSYSRLKEFKPPTVLQSLKILNFKDSRSLLEIQNIDRIPNLETLILWNCRRLLRVCKTIGNLEKLALLNMTGCKNLCDKEQLNSSVKLKASTSGGESTQELSISLPHSLQRLFLNKCKLECTDYLPLSFRDQSSLQYLNLCNSLFEELPCYIHLKNLLVLDLSFCSRLKSLLRLPSTLSELYVYYCKSIEKITFDSGRFTLQEFGYEGCINLSEIEGFLKLVLIEKLDETDLGHMMWLKEYENHDVCLVGDDGLTKYRSCRLQMLYEFNIMSTSLPDIKHPNLTPEYASQYTSLSFDVPSCPGSRSLKGLNVTFRYRISGEDWAWFCKISKTGDSDLIYSPKVFGKPASGEVGIWLSYWPIGNSLKVGNEVKVSIVVMRGLEVLECGARLVYTDDVVTGEILENNIGWIETLGGDLSGFQLITGAYYLCRRDFFEQMEVGRLAPDWFSNLVGDHIDSTEVRGWRMTGRPRQLYQSFTELKTVRCIMYEPETMEGIYKIAELTKSSLVDETMESTSELSEAIPMEGIYKIAELSKSSLVDKTTESTSELSKATPMVVKGTLVLMNNHLISSIGDERKVSIQLISATHIDSDVTTAKGLRGKLGKERHLKNWSTTKGDSTFGLEFDVDDEFGIPGAFLITNRHSKEFYLKTLTLEHVPNYGRVHFICNSWVYPHMHYHKKYRVFFSNQTYLPWKTPDGLRHYREEELEELRGNGTGKCEEWHRVYDYDVYNDLSEPDKGPEHVRPIFGGSTDHPYPRRCRTGRPPTKTDPNMESRISILNGLEIYVPRDERFSELKMADVYSYGIKFVNQGLLPGFESVIDKISDAGTLENVLHHKFESISSNELNEFSSFEEVLKLYEGVLNIHNSNFLESIREKIPNELFGELLRSDGEPFPKFPVPQVIKENECAWRTDEEFARELLAGICPVVIRRLREFPPTSKLDPAKFGNQNSTITVDHIEDQLDGFTVLEAIKNNRLFILDHHDPLMPYLRGINETSTKIYATRTILYLQTNGTLKPLVIELSLPHPDGDQAGVISTVHTPASEGAKGTIWLLAKAYVNANDSGYHQLITHWLHTHASIEPFIIATNRQLSILHPVHKLLHPHFRDTMNINALSRHALIYAGGLLEKTLFPDKYSLEMSSNMYKEWNFTKQALPADLIDRGMAVEDRASPYGVRLLIEDYPFAVDGLKIWSAIEMWVQNYIFVYYMNDRDVQEDVELQCWWQEVRTTGHGDKKDEPWWPHMNTRKNLIESCTIIIWVASALHAAVNFGQYSYAGYMPNRPSITRRFLPEPGTADYDELEKEPEKSFLKTVTAQLRSILGISLIEVLSRHSADEVYLGERDTPEWTTDKEALEAFDNFGTNLRRIEGMIEDMNLDERLKNRTGPAQIPYTLLCPSSGIGLTGRGIPNSVSI